MRDSRFWWILIAVDTTVGLVSSLAFKATPPIIFLTIITATGVALLGELLYRQLTTIGSPTPELLTSMEEALERASKMQKPARDKIYAMWTIVPYMEHLKGYFGNTLSKNIYTERLIDIKNVPIADILDHIEASWDPLSKKLYEIYFVQDVDYEVLVVDSREAALFHYPGRGTSCVFLKHSERKFVTVMVEMFERLRGDANSIRFPTSNFGVQFNRATVERWLNDKLSSVKE